MGINHLHEACDQAAAQLDAVLAEIEPFETMRRGADMYAVLSLAQTSLRKVAALNRGDDDLLTDGTVGLIQMTTAALTGRPAGEGLELAAIGQIVDTTKANMRAGL
jgi:hypothetical protein